MAEVSTELDRLRETYEDDDRLCGDIEEKRHASGVREGHGLEPEAALSMVTEDDSVPSLEGERACPTWDPPPRARQPPRDGGVRGGSRSDTTSCRREPTVRTARRDLLELVAQAGSRSRRARAFRDVAAQFERLVKELFPGGEGRLVLTDSAHPLEAGIEIEASPGRKRVK